MIALWVIHTLWTGILLVLAARLLESGARSLRLPLRWIWVAALVATLGLAAFTTYASSRPAAGVPLEHARTATVRVPAADPGTSSIAVLLDGAAAGFRAIIDAPASFVRQHAPRAFLPRASAMLGGLWLAASVALAVVFLLTLLRDMRVRRAWPRELIAGERVRVAPTAGPAVVGLLRPEIVVPSWLLRAPAAQQRMVVAHEAAHLRARDNLPLAFCGLALVLLPWHAGVWWMAARLRLAVELDCDARVIRAGAPVRRYGDMLVDMAARRAALPLGSVALTETRSHLERRIVAMTESTGRRAIARATVASAAAVLLTLAACEADLPTASEMEAMDVSDVEEQIALVAGTLEPLYIIDGGAADAEVAHALAPEQIARVDVVKGARKADGTPARGEIRIITAAEARRRGLTDTALRIQRTPDLDTAAGQLFERESQERTPFPEEGFTGMLFIDGRRVDPGALRSLSPDAIERVEVLKGAAAARLYSEPEAANGVIQITTKHGARP